MGNVQRQPTLPTDLADIKKRLAVLERTSRLNSASIGSGGLTVRNGGGIRVEDGGQFVVDNGGQIALTNGGLFNLNFPNAADGTPGPPFFSTAATDDDDATFHVQKANGYRLFSASMDPGTPEGQVRIGQQIDPNPPGIFLEGATVGVGSVANIVLAPGNLLRFIGIAAQTGAANLRINGSGDVGIASSLRSMKDEIEPLDVDPADVLKVEPVTYVPKATPEDDRMAGVIADDVAEIPGMEPFLTRDEDGELTGFDYGTFPMALLAVVKDQARQIADLTSRLDAIERTNDG